jgi:hypothetical protein
LLTKKGANKKSPAINAGENRLSKKNLKINGSY